MSRWRSPQAAAKRAQRAAKEAEQLRREKRNSRLLIVGVALISISLVFADYFWLRAQARRRREEHLQRQHQRAQTNSPTPRMSGEQTNSANAH